MSKLNWDALSDQELAVVLKKADAGEQWRCPIELESTYCALDCIATLQLFDYIFEPLMKRFPMMWEYHEGPFIRTIHELVDQQIAGARVNVPMLQELEQTLESSIAELEDEFFRLPEVRPFLEEWREMQIAKINVPTRLKKNGEVSKNYIKYEEKVAKMRQDSRFCFNPGSDKQLQWLFYERLYKNKPKTITYNKRDIPCYELESPRGSILLPATKAGQPPIDKNALPWLGPAGDVLLRRAKQDTSLTTFVRPYLMFSQTSYDGVMHPGWKVPEAVTGRLGGSKPNFQQITGDKRVLAAIEARPGYVLVERDWCALEDYVAANVTQCPGLLTLYGPHAVENDGHLWLGAQLPVLGEKIRQYYDKDNPTPESIAEAKDKCKHERAIAKKVKYSATYGIGAFKLWQDLMCEGVNIDLDTVAQVLRGYWDVFHGMKKHKWKLKDEWERNRGWIHNAIGRPMSVGDHHLKDLFSRCVQGGGHDLQMMFGQNVANAVRDAGLDARPYIYDLHDATYWEVREEDLEKYLKLSTEAADKVWEWCQSALGWNCRLSVSAAWGRTLKELKES